MKIVALAVLALGAAAPFATCAQPAAEPTRALIVTPQGCHWIDRAARVQELWCRGEDGRMAPTSTVRQDVRNPADDGCPRGYLDSGAYGCEREGQVAASLVPLDPLPPTPGPLVHGDQPHAYVEVDRNGRRRGVYVEHQIPGSDVSVIQRVPRSGY